MTNADAVLLAAAELQPGGGEIDVFALTVRAWRKKPAAFRMRVDGLTLPDHKAVSVAVQHLLGRDLWVPLLERCGPNRVRLTDAGRAKARALVSGAEP